MLIHAQQNTQCWEIKRIIRYIERAHHIVGMDKMNVFMRFSYSLVSITTSNDKPAFEHIVEMGGGGGGGGGDEGA